jgi:hypothetical protein
LTKAVIEADADRGYGPISAVPKPKLKLQRVEAALRQSASIISTAAKRLAGDRVMPRRARRRKTAYRIKFEKSSSMRRGLA